ncbi:hypothetical protein RCO48_04970 [Peribacillus frigoritolerans]|nr:hypothetical protein [Peribacillus frigoritolerans]
MTNKETTTEEKTISEIVTDIQIDADNAAVEIVPTKDKETRIELVSKRDGCFQVGFHCRCGRGEAFGTIKGSTYV